MSTGEFRNSLETSLSGHGDQGGFLLAQVDDLVVAIEGFLLEVEQGVLKYCRRFRECGAKTNCTSNGGRDHGQLSTNCTTIGNQTNCDTYDYGAQNRAAYQAGQQIGAAVGAAGGGLIRLFAADHAARREFNKLRDQRCRMQGAGTTWNVDGHSGVCTAKQAQLKGFER